MKFAVLDFETTGHQATDEIIQIGLVLLDGQMEEQDAFSSYVKPEQAIPPFISQLTGITDADVAEAPSLEEAMRSVLPHLQDAVLVAHNAGFDLGFLNRALEQCGYMSFSGRTLDTVALLKVVYPSLTTYQLGAAAQQFDIAHERPHQADSDARATAHLLQLAAAKMRELPLLTLERLAELLQDTRDLGWFVQQLLQEKQDETSLDLQANRYYRSLALQVEDWTDTMPPREGEGPPLTDVSYETFIEQLKSSFREHAANYEDRAAQHQMFDEVHEALEADRHLLIEAGTGTGKSMGYLIPGLFYGIKHDAKIVVSTHTINLQEQLRARDIPQLQAIMPFDFRAAVFKGRGNYLCLRKFENKLTGQEFGAPSEDKMTAAQMVVWLNETEHGDQEELHFGNRGNEFWNTVSSDADSCLNRACPWFRRCYYHRAKQEANTADVIITNHSLLFTDIRAEHRLLPGYERLIVDEAHHLEEVAGKHLGMRVSQGSIHVPLQRLCKDVRTGQVHQLRAMLAQEDDEYSAAWTETIDTLVPAFLEARESWEELLELLYAATTGGRSEASPEAPAQTVVRLKKETLPSGWEGVQAAEERVYSGLGRLVKEMDKLIGQVKERVEDSGVQSLVTDINGAVKDAARARDELHLFTRLDEPLNVYWIEASERYRAKSVHLYAVPADVSAQLKQYLFEAKKSVILTSATLSVQKSFAYACEQFGLSGEEEQGRLKTVQLPSPFNYREQALVMIPRNFPTLRGAAGESAFVEKLVASLAEAAAETKGRMLVLFTSYRMLRQVYEPLRQMLERNKIDVIGQGMDSGNRSKLTRRFREQPQAVLLGTSSFWEGVDIPGEDLTCLAIVRLPFQPPNHPLVEAKAELLQQAGQNPFMKLSIPQAVIRFKQGFGRLVRSGSDRGIVLIYDTRVIESYYGKHFLYSLPGPKIEHMHLEQIVPRIRQWLGAESKEA
ncbi:ATP-dependent DNA helicase DinG [Paenibacillus sp. IB182496]|uniref:3'-5' exonuclease DinG n=1 Tax=Paenibacillus sabuli TaxID=2772509 RepID=A0A927BTA5_9BACL|nr:ATP-dependent DNA helicase DinG [Paenibacillus sabuli]MBD2845124.1 ATP-dependent DNA helicase DinG [Paenibacillus sabuli]